MKVKQELNLDFSNGDRLDRLYFKLLRVDILQQNPLLLILLFVNLIIFNKSELYGYILLICFIYYNYILFGNIIFLFVEVVLLCRILALRIL